MSAPSYADIVAALDLAIYNAGITGQPQSVTIGGFSASNYPLPQLLQARREYAALAAAAANANGSLQIVKVTNCKTSAS